MSSATPILTYFDIRGLGELPRLLFVAAGAEFVDNRIELQFIDGRPQGPWLAQKEATPFHQIPTLQVGDVVIPQSAAIVRYIANTYGLTSKDSLQAALIDAGFEASLDIRKAYFTVKADAEKVAAFWAKDLGEKVALLNANAKGPFYGGAELSYTDVAIYYLLWVLATENKEAVDAAIAANAKIAAIYKAVETNEKVAAYLAKRKVTPM